MDTAIMSGRHTLAELEDTIERGKRTFVEVGEALLEINERRLYREQGFGTFETYCMERWSFSRIQAYRLIQGVEVVHNLLPHGNIPLTEYQARQLAPLPPAEQREIAQQVDFSQVSTRELKAIIQAKRNPDGPSQPMAVTVFSHRSVEYYTPTGILDAARAVLGGFDLDPASCAEAQVNVRAARFYTAEDDGLSKAWEGRVWLNPPYGIANGQSNQATWSGRLVAEYMAGRVTESILLVKAALGYRWFEQLFRDWPVCFVRERIAFIQEDGDDDGQSKQGTALFYFGPDESKFARVFRTIGRVIPSEEVLDAALHR